MAKKNVVTYVVGTTLDGPVVATHVLNENEHEQPFPNEVAVKEQKGQKIASGKNIHRKYGHPNKESRVKYQGMLQQKNAQKRGKK